MFWGNSKVPCFDCKKTNIEYYMFEDVHWEKVWPNYSEFESSFTFEQRPSLQLCFACVEKRLRRKLTLWDFKFNWNPSLNENHVARLFPGYREFYLYLMHHDPTVDLDQDCQLKEIDIDGYIDEYSVFFTKFPLKMSELVDRLQKQNMEKRKIKDFLAALPYS